MTNTDAAPAGLRVRPATMLAAGAVLAWCLMFLGAPAGLLQVDEVVQFAAISALADTGRLTVENGAGLSDSGDLRLAFLFDGPNGLAAQYPAGFQVLAAPALALGGLRGAMAVNLVSGLAALWLTFSIVRLLSDRQTALLAAGLLFGASFLVNYVAIALWPHALSLALALGVVRCAVACARTPALRPGPALLGGALLGLGASVRPDIMLVMPGLGAWVLLTAGRPYAHGGLAAIGIAPVLLAASWVNQVKFGVFSPATYGTGTGASGIDIGAYAGLGLVVAGIGVLLILWRHAPGSRPVLAGAMAVLGLGAVAVLPEVRAVLLRLGAGAWHLVIDLTGHPEVGRRAGIVRDETGIVTFWGIHKKALVQSLPWLGILPLAAAAPREHRSGALLGLLISASVILPFSISAWHGGYGPNMRYFLYALPFLAHLGALALLALHRASPAEARPLLVSALATFLGLATITSTVPGLAGHLIEHRLPPVLALALLVLALAQLATRRAGKVLWPVAAVAIAWSAYSAYMIDVPRTNAVRAWSAQTARAYAAAPVGPALFYDSLIRAQAPVLRNPEQIAAGAGNYATGVDPALVRAALGAGMAIVIREPALQADLDAVLAAEGLEVTREVVPGPIELTVTRPR